MNSAITALLAAIRLAPVSQVEQLNGDVRRTETKIGQLERQLEQARADAPNWKRRYEDTTEVSAAELFVQHGKTTVIESSTGFLGSIQGE